MPHAVDTSCQEELRRAGLLSQGSLPRLLAMLRAAPETHLSLAEVVRMASETGLTASPVELAVQLETLVEHGLLGRVLSTSAELVFDTVTEPHSHLVYEDTAQVVDLRVSPETLIAILRRTLAERPDGVEIIIRLRRDPVSSADRAAVADTARRRGRTRGTAVRTG
jgi:Fur family iron response transcriptional regulator